MLLSDLIFELEEMLDNGGDMIVLLGSGAPVEEVDFSYQTDADDTPRFAAPDAIVIK